MIPLTFLLLIPIQRGNIWYVEVPEKTIVITGQFNNSGYDKSILGSTSSSYAHSSPIKVNLNLKNGEEKEIKVNDNCIILFKFENSVLTIKHSHDYMLDPVFGVLNIKGKKFYRVKFKENRKSIRPLEYRLDQLCTGITPQYTPDGLKVIANVYNYLAGKFNSGKDSIVIGFGPNDSVDAYHYLRTRYQSVNSNCRVRVKFNYLCEKKSINPLRFELKCSENDNGGYRFVDVIAEDLKVYRDGYWHTYSKIITTPEGSDDIGMVWRLSTTKSELKYGIYMIDGFKMEYLDIQTTP